MNHLIFNLLFLFFILSGCQENLQINSVKESDIAVESDKTRPTVTIDQAMNETVGSCSFSAVTEPTKKTNFSFRIIFSEEIDSSNFTISDITNAGSGGSFLLEWELENCGDNKNFKLTAKDIEGNGTIVPSIVEGGTIDTSSNLTLASTSTDNSIQFGRTWIQEAYIKASNADADDGFGTDVFINGDTLVISASDEASNQVVITNGTGSSANNSNSGAGAVYIYRRTGTTWIQEAYIKASNNNASDDFGNMVSINRDTLAVGADFEDSNQTTITNGTAAGSANNSSSGAGAVYVYKRTGSMWAQEAYIKASNANTSDFFGRSVSVHGDTLAVGATGEDSSSTTIINGAGTDSDNSFTSSGAVYVYKRTGATWAQEAILRGDVSNSFNYFGHRVSVEGDTIVASAVGGGDYASGIAFVFRRSGATWTQESTLIPFNEYNFIRFGEDVSLSKNSIAIGTSGDSADQTTITNGPTASDNTDSSNSGAVFIYKKSGSSWIQEAYIKPSNNDADDRFGISVSLEGDMLAVGSMLEASNQTTITNGPSASADNSRTNSGAVYVFERKGTYWSQKAYIKSTNADSFDFFGQSVSLSGDTIAVGAIQESSNQTTITNGSSASADNSLARSGAVYIYRYDGKLFDVTDVWGTSDSSSVTLRWHRTGGLATGYVVAYQMGSTAPADCSSGTVIDVGDANTHHELALSSTQTYSFRVCATDGTEITAGTAFTISTL